MLDVLLVMFFIISVCSTLLFLDAKEKLDSLKIALEKAESWEAFYEDWVKILDKSK